MDEPDLDDLTTEGINPDSEHLDRLSSLELVQLMNREDAGVAAAVGREAVNIAAAVDAIAERMKRKGRLIYIGAGTSGRLGVLDAAECTPTFSSPVDQVVGLIAGGREALESSAEGAEDYAEDGAGSLEEVSLRSEDAVVGISASGRAPFVLGALAYARERGALTVAFSCNEGSPLAAAADIAITPVVGPEVLSGSTRLKAGTATKMVLNMLSTGAFVRLGKTWGNLMVDLRATNDKLARRALRIVCLATGLPPEAAQRELDRCGGDVRKVIRTVPGTSFSSESCSPQ